MPLDVQPTAYHGWGHLAPGEKLPGSVLDGFRRALGAKNVLTEETELRLYSYDAAIDRALPSAVLFPESAQQIAAAVSVCYKNKVPFVARGAGTNLCGCTVPFHNGVVIAPTRMKRVLAVDPVKRVAVVEPGLPNLFLKKALQPYGLYYAPDPASQKACTIGGNIGTNAGGPHCLKYGVTSHHVLALEAVLPDGTMADFSVNDPGYDLTGLFVGSEGTLGIVTRATLNLLPIPERVETMLAPFPSLESAIHAVTEIIAAGIIPATLEAMDRVTIHAVEAFVHAGYPLDAEAVLLIEVDGGYEVRGQVADIEALCRKNGAREFRLAGNEAEREKLWEGRRGSYPSLARLAPNVLVEDGVVPRNLLPEALKRVRAIAEREGLNVSLIFHAGDGNLHPQILFDERDVEQTRKVKAAGYEMLKACVDLGGSVSGEHGIGSDKREAMRWLFTPQTLARFRSLKTAFDPDNISNPDKLIPAVEPVPAAPLPAPAAGPGELKPASREQAAGMFQALRKAGRKAAIRGLGTRTPHGAGTAVSTSGMNRILEHDLENFTVAVEAGMEVRALQAALAAAGRKAIVAPGGSLGGAIAANAAQTPRLRDQVLGMQVVLADGTWADFGGKVVKNVAGYDVCKLFIGSRGTIGLIYSVILKTYPLNYPLAAGPQPPAFADRGTGQGLPAAQAAVKRAFDPDGLFPSLSDVLEP